MNHHFQGEGGNGGEEACGSPSGREKEDGKRRLIVSPRSASLIPSALRQSPGPKREFIKYVI